MKLSRRRKIVFALVSVLAVTGYVALFVPFGLTIKDADRLRLGMSQAEVEALLGKPDMDAFGTLIWEVTDGDITVMMSVEHVSIVSVKEYSRWDRVNDRIRAKLGLAISPRGGRDRIILVDW